MYRPFIWIILLFGTLAVAAAQNPAPSWRDRAEAYAAAKQFDSAAHFYQRWVEADPGDENSWYNLACVLALTGERDGALNAFEAAVTAGWSDPEWPMEDPDLTTIRSSPRFAGALERIRTRGTGDGPAGYRRHFVATKTVGTYIAMLPPDYDTVSRRYPLCVILHGAGSTELAHGRLADRLGRDDVVYIAVRAPYAVSIGDASRIGYTSGPSERPDSTDPFEWNFPVAYADWIVSCIDDARGRYRIDSRPAILLGHSQGAAMSMITATLHPAHVRAAFAYAGYLPPEIATADRLDALRTNKVDFTLAHGTEDAVVEPKHSTTATELLRSHGVVVNLMMFDSTAHGITQPVMDEMKKWKEARE